jgi:hypothetical protein
MDRGGLHHLDEANLTTRVCENATEWAHNLGVHRANRANRADLGRKLGVPHCEVTGHPAFYEFFKNDVCLIQANLGPGRGVVVNLR